MITLRRHLAFLDGLRALAALYVVLHHAVMNSWPPWGRMPNGLAARCMVEAFAYGRYAVAIFIVLSGFCLALPLVASGGEFRDGLGGFFRRRARRILPPYYAAVALCLGFIVLTGTHPTGSLWDFSVKLSGFGVLSHLLLVQDWFGALMNGQINYVLWSVAVEWHIYFLFPVIIWLWTRTSPLISTVSIVIITVPLGWVLRETPLTYLNVQFVGLFALGMFAAALSHNRAEVGKIRRKALSVATFSLIAVVLLSAKFGWIRMSHAWPAADLLVGFAVTGFLVYLRCTPESSLLHALEWRLLVAVGGFSYSVYLVHAPVLQCVWLISKYIFRLGYLETGGFVMVFGVALTLGVAWVFHLCFERPFLRPPAAAPALEFVVT